MEESVATAQDQRLVIANGVCESDARGEVIGIKRHATSARPRWILRQPTTKDLQVITQTKIQGEMVGYSDRILHEPGILLRIGMGNRVSKILQVIAGDAVCICAKRT